MRSQIILLLLAVFTVLATSCDGTPVAPHPDPGPSVPPKVGSTFTFRLFLIDSTGHEINSTSKTVTATIVSSNASYAGKTGLTLVEEDSVRYYLHYDSSGDVSVHSASGDTSGVAWHSWPFGSRSFSVTKVSDTSGGAKNWTIFYSDYDGAGFTTTPAGQFNVHRCITDAIETRDSTTSGFTSTVKRWYAPSLGFEVMTTKEPGAPDATLKYRQIKELVSYSLK